MFQSSVLKKYKASLSGETLAETYKRLVDFTRKKSQAQALQQEINRLDHEIDQIVYELYGLTEDEIKIVEESVG